MHRGFWLAAALSALGGCYAPPQNADYGAQAAYPGAGYPAQQYPPGVYPAAPYDPNAAAYPGYDYGSGAPTIIEGGAPVPLVLLGGEWGFYDRERHWHRAPDDVRRRFEEHRDGGPAFRHDGPPSAFRPDAPRFGEGYGQSRPEGRPPFGQRFGAPPGGVAGFRPAEQPRPVGPPAAPARPAPFSAPPGVLSNFRPSPPPAPAHPEGRQMCPPGQRC